MKDAQKLDSEKYMHSSESSQTVCPTLSKLSFSLLTIYLLLFHADVFKLTFEQGKMKSASEKTPLTTTKFQARLEVRERARATRESIKRRKEEHHQDSDNESISDQRRRIHKLIDERAAHKAEQNAYEGLYLDDVPQLGVLNGVERIGMSISDWTQAEIAKEYFAQSHRTKFHPIQFWVWEERMFYPSDKVLLLAEIQCGHGFAVRSCFSEEEYFHVSPAPRSSTIVYGSIKSPSGKTLFQFDSPREDKFHVQPVGVVTGAKYEIEMCESLCMSVGKTLRLISDEVIYELRNKGLLIAVIQQKASVGLPKTYAIQFREKDAHGSEVGCLALGFALLLTLKNEHKDLEQMLLDSVGRRSAHSSFTNRDRD